MHRDIIDFQKVITPGSSKCSLVFLQGNFWPLRPQICDAAMKNDKKIEGNALYKYI